MPPTFGVEGGSFSLTPFDHVVDRCGEVGIGAQAAESARWHTGRNPRDRLLEHDVLAFGDPRRPCRRIADLRRTGHAGRMTREAELLERLLAALRRRFAPRPTGAAGDRGARNEPDATRQASSNHGLATAPTYLHRCSSIHVSSNASSSRHAGNDFRHSSSGSRVSVTVCTPSVSNTSSIDRPVGSYTAEPPRYARPFPSTPTRFTPTT